MTASSFIQPTTPMHHDSYRYPIYSPDFAANPMSFFEVMRANYPSLVPIDLAPDVPATLVISHKVATRILNDPEHFRSDPRPWQATIPADAAVLAMMGYLPAARFNDGAEHLKYRDPSAAGINGVDLNGMMPLIESVAIPVINTFCYKGSADLMTDYTIPVVLSVLNQICGCPPDIAERIVRGTVARFDQESTLSTKDAMAMIKRGILDLVQHKREHPGNDATTRLMTHESNLDDTEMLANLTSFYGAGFELQRNVIVNTLHIMLTDSRYQASFDHGGNLSTTAAIDEVLFRIPPMTNFCFRYSRQPILVDDTWLPADQPVVISLAACNNDPEITGTLEAGGTQYGNQSHLAWGKGPHECPAKALAYRIAEYVIDEVLNALPDMSVAVPEEQLVWRPGPFSRGLVALPVVFDPASPLSHRSLL